MEFCDRVREMERLERLCARASGGLAVVWGRRRIGKTRLLVELAKRRGGEYLVADQSGPSVQRRYLAQALERRFPGFSAVDYPDWDAFLTRITAEARASRWHGPLILDEFPYLVQYSPELPSIMQRWVDHALREAGLTVVIAGSSQRMMQGLVLDPSEPLYGRAKEKIRLEPLSAAWIAQALKLRDAERAVEHWAVWGGVPYYWELVEEERSGALETLIDRLVLDPHGPLHREPEFVLLEEVPSALALRPLLDAIGMGAHRVSEIAARLAQPSTALSHPVGRLCDMDLVTREVPFGESEKSSKRSLYRIADPFFRFWFRVVAPNRAFLTRAAPRARIELLRNHLPHLLSTAWEELCRMSVPALSKAGLASSDGSWIPAARYWHGSGPEWDIVSSAAGGKAVLIGEAKWFVKTPGEKAIRTAAVELIRKGVPPLKGPAPRAVHYALFVPRKPVHKIELPERVSLIDAEEVLECLL